MVANLRNDIYKYIGKLMILIFYSLYFSFYYSFVFDVLESIYILNNSRIMITIQLMLGSWIAFNVFFNYNMSTFTDPGNTQHFYQKYNEQIEMVVNYSGSRLRECRHCQKIKPLRTHHCSVCNRCVFKMDHHCPWINNCVGHKNHRYFLLLVFYISMFTSYQSLLFLWIFRNKDCYSFYYYKKDPTYFRNINPIVNTVVAICTFFLTLFYWYLAFKGKTLLEYLSEVDLQQQYQQNQKQGSSIDQQSVADHLELIFGTRSYWRIMLPSFRMLQFEGFCWDQKLQDLVIESHLLDGLDKDLIISLNI